MSQQQTILIVTAQPERFVAFGDRMRAESGVRLLVAHSADDAMEAAVRESAALVIVDDQIGDVAGLILVRRLLERNAFIHTAVVSDLTEEAFHEKSEGLGILARLPVYPQAADADALLARLRQMIPAK